MNLEAILNQLNTPCLLLDKGKLHSNILNMQEKANRHSVSLRPHMKTAKCVSVAAAFDSEHIKTPITVSTLREAEYFAEYGYQDILYAVSLEPGKFARLTKLYQRGVKVTVILDDLSVAKALNDYCRERQITALVMIEIDVDGHRAGLVPDHPDLVALARLLQESEYIDFIGLMTHGGGSYDCQSWTQVEQHAQLEQQRVLLAAQRCRDIGIGIQRISIGSTPTVIAANGFDGIDEIRPGVFVFFDVFQMQLGACQFSDIALSVLCSVVAHKADDNRLIVDAGGLALSKDRSTQGTQQDVGYGLVADLAGKLLEPAVCISDVNQEHGIIDLPSGMSCRDFPIGCRLRIFPNHACMTAAAYEGYTVIDNDGTAALDYWSRCNGW